MSHHLLTGVWVKINRAKKHLADLESEIKAFHESNPYRVETDAHTEPGHEIYRFWFNRPIPIEWGGIVGDAIHNLRSALDNLAVATVLYNGVTDADTIKKTYFPITRSKQILIGRLPNDLKGASIQTRRLVERLNPYQGGADAFWRIHQLDILDKHTVIVPVGAASSNIGMKFPFENMFAEMGAPAKVKVPDVPYVYIKPDKITFPLKDGDILFRYGHGPDKDGKFKPKFKLKIDIAFGEGQIIDGQPVAPTLKQFIDFIERVVQIFDKHIFV